MFVFIASVHHTGTQFAQKLFEDLGYIGTDKTPKEAGNSVNYFHRSHIAPSILTELKMWLEIGVPIVVPMRHPWAVVQSWLARKKALKQLMEQYELLFRLVDTYPVLYLPLDTMDREVYLHHLRLECDPLLTTNWPVIGSDAKLERVPIDDEGAAILVDLIDEPLMQRFYPGAWTL
jgi:hypothetical protein